MVLSSLGQGISARRGPQAPPPRYHDQALPSLVGKCKTCNDWFTKWDAEKTSEGQAVLLLERKRHLDFVKSERVAEWDRKKNSRNGLGDSVT